MIRNDSRATNLVARKSSVRSCLFNSWVRLAGRIFARQRISSAIQLPIPENPDCIKSTALMGALPCRSRNESKNFRVNAREAISGIVSFHHAGEFIPW